MITLGDNWLMYLEFMTFIVSITNTFLLYFVSERFKEFLRMNLGIHNTNRQLWVVISCEHILLAFIIFLKVGIDDFPRKLLKLMERIQTELGEKEEIEKKEIEKKIEQDVKPALKQPLKETDEDIKARMRKQIAHYNKDVTKIEIKSG